jgi:hypothetical protein
MATSNTCDYCESGLSLVTYMGFDFRVCQKCYKHVRHIDPKDECLNHHIDFTEPVKLIQRNGSVHISKRCMECGTIKTTEYVPKDKVDDIDSLDVVRLVDLDIKSKNLQRAIDAIMSRAEEKRKELWLQEHDSYLKSDLWRKKRELVMNRDGHMCQACLSKKAEHVHHLSYKHWKNEPLFDLISVCKECHDSIHEKKQDD